MTALKRFICIFFLSLFSSITSGQEVEEKAKEEEGKHRITFMPSHTLLKLGVPTLKNGRPWHLFPFLSSPIAQSW
jgi:hypothetical protein